MAICLLDLDAFYAGVEQARDPTLQGKPLAVLQRTAIATCSYEARALGVPKLSIWAEQKAKHPELIGVQSDMDRYREASERVEEILVGVFGADRVEKGSIDEFYIDVSAAEEMLGEAPVDFAGDVWRREGEGDDELTPTLRAASHLVARARATLMEKMQLGSSAGIASNRTASKLACIRKPYGQLTLPNAGLRSFVRMRAGTDGLRCIPGAGKVTLRALEEIEVQTLDDVLAKPREALKRVGTERLWDLLHTGDDGSGTGVRPKGRPQTISCSFHAREDTWQGVFFHLNHLSVELCRRLNVERKRHHRTPKVLTVQIANFNGGFSGSRSMPFPERTAAWSDNVCAAALKMAQKAVQDVELNTRVIGVGGTNFFSTGMLTRETKVSVEDAVAATGSAKSVSALDLSRQRWLMKKLEARPKEATLKESGAKRSHTKKAKKARRAPVKKAVERKSRPLDSLFFKKK